MPSVISKRVWLTAADETSKAKSNKLKRRDPRHASTQEGSFQNQTHISDQGEKILSPAAAPLRIARMESLPPSLQIKRDQAVQQAARPTVVETDAVDYAYPPNSM